MTNSAKTPAVRSQTNFGLIALCSLLALLEGSDAQSMAIGAPLIARELGLDFTALGLVFSASLLGGSVGAVFGGSRADRIGPSRVLAFCMVWFGLGQLATIAANTYPALLAIRALAGLGLGGATPCILALAAGATAPHQRARVLGIVWTCLPLGAFLGGFLNGWLLASFSWHAMFVVSGVASIGLAVIVWLVGRRSDRIASSARGTTAVAETSAATRPSTTSILRRPDVRAHLLLTGLILFGAMGSLSGIVAWLPSIIVKLGFSASSGAVVLSAHAFGSLTVMATAGFLVARYGSRVLAIAFLAVVGALGAAALSTESLTSFTVAAAALGACQGLVFAAAVALAGTIFPDAIRSTAIGASMAAGRIGQVLIPSLVGAGLQSLPPPQVLMILGAVPAVGAIAALLLGRALRLSDTGPAGAFDQA